MKRMKLFALSLLMGAALFSCGDDYDDTALKNEIDDLKTRVEKLEDWCDTANGQISALQGLVSAMEQNDYITGVTPVVEGTKETGYIITFAKSDPITIRHGKDGTDGNDGNDGITPVIGAKQDTDGKYYWTIKTGDEDPVWMTDAEGNKIRTTGDDAATVKPVISVDTDTDGKLYWKIDGEWLLDKENKKVPATGEKGDKGDKGDTGATGGSGSQGATGEQGPQGDAVFKKDGIKLDDAGYVTFTLADGTEFTVPRSGVISIGTKGIFYYQSGQKSCEVPITLPTNFTKDDYASIMAEVKSSYGTSVDIKTRAAGDASDPAWKVEVTAPTFDSNGKYEENSAKVTLTAPTNVATDAAAWLEVTILDTKGKKSTAACAIKVVAGLPVTTPEALSSAFGVESGTANTPVKITLGADITVASAATVIKGFKDLDGNGNTLTNGQFGISSDNDASPSSLVMSNTTLVNPQLSVSNNGTLTLGNGVSITSASSANPFAVTGSGEMTVDGATFSQTAQTDGFSWVHVSSSQGRSVAYSRSTSNQATLILKDFTFTNLNDYISISGAATIQMVPGDNKSLNLFLDHINPGDLTITPISDTFSQADVERLSIRTGSIINGEDGDGYEFNLDNGTIKLKKKDGGITTFDALTAAIADATGTKEDPTVIRLGADITVPVLDNGTYNIASIPIGDEDGLAPKHIRLEGNGHSLIAGGDGIWMMQVGKNSSLILTHITLDGAGKKSATRLIAVIANAALTLGDGATLKDLKALDPIAMNPNFTIIQSSYGIVIDGLSSLIVESGARISGIEGYGIQVNGIRTDHPDCVTLNGGTFTDNTAADIRLSGVNPNVTPVKVTTQPAGSGASGKLKLAIVLNQSSLNTGGNLAGGSSLNAGDFILSDVADANGQDITDNYELLVEGGILKLRQKAAAGITIDELKEKLKSTNPQSITIDADLTLTETITMGASHTINIAKGKTLTISGNGRIAIGNAVNTLTINGPGTLVCNRSGNSLWKQALNADGSDDLILDKNVTVKVISSISSSADGGINVYKMTVNQGSKVELSASNTTRMIAIARSGSLTVGGTIDIQNFSGIGIYGWGTMTIQSTGVVKVGNGGYYNNYTNHGIYMQGGITLESGGTLSNSTNGNGGIYLLEECDVTGMNGKFSDRGTVFTAAGTVQVGAADAAVSEGGLSEGLYVWDGTRFAKTASTE